MIEDINRIYQQTILDYNNRKDLKKEILNPSYVERGHNPSCGDDLSLLIKIEDDEIKDASFLGNGCAISVASTAMLLEDIKGQKLENVKKIIDEFFLMMRENNDGNEKLLNDAILMKYVSNMPARIKCATLSWHSMKVILEKVGRK